VNAKGLLSFAAEETTRTNVRPEATKLSKPPGELNPQVWQGDLLFGY